MTFTLWDKIEIDEGDLTFEQLLNCFKQKYHLDVLMIGAHDLMIYSYFAPTQIRLIQKYVNARKSTTSTFRSNVSSSKGLRVRNARHKDNEHELCRTGPSS
jgi:hypothetical protein